MVTVRRRTDLTGTARLEGSRPNALEMTADTDFACFPHLGWEHLLSR